MSNLLGLMRCNMMPMGVRNSNTKFQHMTEDIP